MSMQRINGLMDWQELSRGVSIGLECIWLRRVSAVSKFSLQIEEIDPEGIELSNLDEPGWSTARLSKDEFLNGTFEFLGWMD